MIYRRMITVFWENIILRINKPDSAEYYLNAAISANIGGPRENDAAAKILLAETYTMNADYRAAYSMQKECVFM